MVVAASVGSDKPWEGRERSMQLLVTGATGKVGVNLIERLLSDPRWRVARVRALCHSRTIPETDRIGSSKEASKTAIASIAQCAT